LSSPVASALLLLLVVASAFVAFLPTLDAGFVNWDDDLNFINNPHFRGLGWANLHWMFTTIHDTEASVRGDGLRRYRRAAG